jgi:hypothetical protein
VAEIALLYLPRAGLPPTINVDGVEWTLVRADPAGSMHVALDIDSDDYRDVNEAYAAAQTDNVLIIAPGATKKIVVIGLQFSTEKAGSFTLTSSTGGGTDIYGPHFFPANSGMVIPPARQVVEVFGNEALRITTDIAGDHTISLQAVVVPV